MVAEPLTVSVCPSAIVSVDPVAGAVMATLLIVVAVAAPKTGVVSVGDVANTGLPVPVGVLFLTSLPVVPSNNTGTEFVALAGPTTSPEPPPDGVAQVPSPRQKVVPLAPVPELRFATGRLPVTPVDNGRPVALVRTTAEGVPRAGVTSVGEFANTFAPVPVSSVNAAARLALEGVARNVATLAANPVIPVLTGSPVQFVNVPLDGVPNTGVVSVGLVSVLFVNVSVPARVASVPVVGRTTVPDPAVAAASMMVDPEVEPATASFPTAPAEPNVFFPVTV